ncbi:MAG: transcriptional repressor [Chloroflexi bacterium]|nr:MAG: transcriptional repressor [Chloroflexota bacterium]
MTEQLSKRARRMVDAGYKVTKARMTVLRVFEESGGHITSKEVLERVAAIDENIGRASIFRTLDLFTRLAIIRPTYIETSMTPSYVLLPDGHHHHIICTNCDQVIEFDNCDLSDLAHQLEAEYGIELTGHLLEFYGICKTCAV